MQDQYTKLAAFLFTEANKRKHYQRKYKTKSEYQVSRNKFKKKGTLSPKGKLQNLKKYSVRSK